MLNGVAEPKVWLQESSGKRGGERRDRDEVASARNRVEAIAVRPSPNRRTISRDVTREVLASGPWHLVCSMTGPSDERAPFAGGLIPVPSSAA